MSILFSVAIFKGICLLADHVPIVKIYGVNLRIHYEYRKIRTRKTSVFGHMSRSEIILLACILLT